MEHLKKINMRTYLAKVAISEEMKEMSTGKIGEEVFSIWFSRNFEGESLFKQSADRDYQGIDFVDEKGVKYQVKATKGNTYTFNCDLSDLQEHLRADLYVLVQVVGDYAYIEPIRNASQVLESGRASFNYKRSSFIWKRKLNQHILEL